MYFDFHNYTSQTFLPVYCLEVILKFDPWKFGLFTGEVTINYLNLLLIRAFLKPLNHIVCGSNIDSESYGTLSL